MKKWIALALVVFCAACASIDVFAASFLAWDIAAPDAVTAAAYTFRSYVNGSATGTILTGVTCSGTTTITCQVPFPIVPAGNDSIVVTAQAGGGPETSPSPTFSFPMAPTPSNVRAK